MGLRGTRYPTGHNTNPLLPEGPRNASLNFGSPMRFMSPLNGITKAPALLRKNSTCRRWGLTGQGLELSWIWAHFCVGASSRTRTEDMPTGVSVYFRPHAFPVRYKVIQDGSKGVCSPIEFHEPMAVAGALGLLFRWLRLVPPSGH